MTGIERTCRGCGVVKDRGEFETLTDSHCKVCVAEQDAEGRQSCEDRDAWNAAQTLPMDYTDKALAYASLRGCVMLLDASLRDGDRFEILCHIQGAQDALEQLRKAAFMNA
jgi:hypothetical protein